MSLLGRPRGVLITTVSSGGGRLLPLPAARLRRHTLTAIRAGTATIPAAVLLPRRSLLLAARGRVRGGGPPPPIRAARFNKMIFEFLKWPHHKQNASLSVTTQRIQLHSRHWSATSRMGDERGDELEGVPGKSSLNPNLPTYLQPHRFKPPLFL